jgi:hypothetical protein
LTAGASFVGGANAAEATARCVPAQPDGLANEIECGPLSPSLSPPTAHFGFVATLRAPVACGASFQLEVSANGPSSLRLTRRDARHSVRIVATAAFDGELVQTASNKVAIARR